MINVDNLIAEINTFQEQTLKTMQEMVHNGLKVLFLSYPDVQNIIFTAYTPAFNDGDECVYRCTARYCDFNGNLDEHERTDFNIPKTEEPSKESQAAFKKFLGAIRPDTWKLIVGNNVAVKVTAEGMEIIYYDCGY